MYLLFLSILSAAALVGAPPARPTKPVLERYIRHLKLVAPEVAVEIGDFRPGPVPDLLQFPVRLSLNGVTQDMTFFVTRDGRKLMEGTVYDLARNPYQRELDTLRLDTAPAFGAPPGAPITLVEFSDFECAYCRTQAQSLRRHVAAEFPGTVRVFFKNYAVDPQHTWARAAAIAGRAVYRLRPDAFWAFHDWVFDRQSELNAANFRNRFLSWARSNRLDAAQLAQLLDSRALESEVDADAAEGRKLGIDSTPTLFVNGRRLVGQRDWPSLSVILNAELAFQK